MSTNTQAEQNKGGRPSLTGHAGVSTPQRQVRIPDDIWYGAAAKAAEQGTTASAVVRELLREWLAERS